MTFQVVLKSRQLISQSCVRPQYTSFSCTVNFSFCDEQFHCNFSLDIYLCFISTHILNTHAYINIYACLQIMGNIFTNSSSIYL